MKLLTLSTYPFENPRHGGQQRLNNIAKHYGALGYEIESAGVLGSTGYESQSGFLQYPNQADLEKVLSDTFLMDDFAIGRLFAGSDAHFSSLANRIRNIPDVIHIEHPWLFGFAHRYRQFVGRPDMRLIYGSANVEHKLKREILRAYVSEGAAEVAARQVYECELSAIQMADGICCVSQQDLDWTRQFTDVRCVLAPNGVSRRTTSEAGVSAASQIAENKKFALYCASAHPPNITGFFDIFGAGLGSLAPDQLLVLVGGVGQSIATHPLAGKTPGLRSRMKVAGEVDEPTLQALLDTAHAIVLPITQGEGTNLKTAEAIWAKKYVLATTKAMRGFERFSSSPSIFVHDAPHDFLRSLQQVMCAEAISIPASELPDRASVLWENCLRPLNFTD